MMYSEEEIGELKRFAAAYGYELELTCARAERESASAEMRPVPVIRMVPEKLLTVPDEKAS